MFNQIKNTVAFVTGGASGLGLGTVKRLIDQGAKGVVAFDLRKGDYTHDKLMSLEGDVTKEDDVKTALEQCEKKFGSLTAVVNCAGVAVATRIYDHRKDKIHPLDSFRKVIEVNTIGTFNVSRLAAVHLVKNEMVGGQKGVIIMTSSVASYDGQIGQAAYAASKGAVNGMTLAIARDLSNAGVRCVTIEPGLFNTPTLKSLPGKVRNQLAAIVSCPSRLGDPLEYGHLVQTIIENPMLNGEVVRLDDRTSLKDLIDIFEKIPGKSDHSIHLGLMEERAINILTKQSSHDPDDDIISRFLPPDEYYDYESLCSLLVKMAEYNRRSPPLLRVTAETICKLPLTYDARPDMIVSALSSLVKLNYPNRKLIGKLTTDLYRVIDLSRMKSNELSNVIRILSNLRWRHPELINTIYKHIDENHSDLNKIDHATVASLLHCTAVLNFIPNLDLKQFYAKIMKHDRECLIDPSTRKWLHYVWTLTSLNLADAEHLTSVLNDEYVQSIADRITYSDKVKLLNLYAIAQHEFKIDVSSFNRVNEFKTIEIIKGPQMLKFSQTVADSMDGFLKSSKWFIRDTQTPFGFIVDGELHLDADLEPIDPSGSSIAARMSKLGDVSESDGGRKRCALIYVSFEETVSNNMIEPVGHKNMISRILSNFGYVTIFMPETIVNREKTSSDLCVRIKTMIQSAISSKSDDIK